MSLVRFAIPVARRSVLLILLLLFATAPASAEPAGSAATSQGSAVSPDQARSTLAILKDDKRRAELISTLEAIAAAGGSAAPAADTAAAAPAPAAAPATPSAIAANLPPDSLGAQLLLEATSWIGEANEELQEFVTSVADVPQLWGFTVRTLTDPIARYSLLDAAWKLAVIVAAALLVEFALWRLVRRPARALEHGSPNGHPAHVPDPAHGEVHPVESHEHKRHGRGAAWASGLSFLRRLPFALLHGIVELLPVAAFAIIGNLALSTPLGATPTARLVALAVVNAYVLLRAIMCCVRVFTNSDSERLRLLPISGETGAYLEVWFRRILATGLFGGALAEIGLALGLSQSAHMAIMKLVMLLIHIFVVIMLLQSRAAVAHWIAGPPERKSAFASFRRRFAVIWIYPVIFLVIASWVVWAVELRDGLYRLLTFFLSTVAVLIVARLVGIVALGGLDRLFRVHPDMHRRYPGLEARANRYYPILRRLVTLLIVFISAVALLQVWGLDAVSWFSNNAVGSRVVSAGATILVATLLAIVIWEFVTAMMDRHLASLNRIGHYERAARVRTLLPMVRTGLLIVIVGIVGLTILSEIGVNIAPLLAGAGILGVALGFGSQKLVQDFITGIFLLLENAMQVGDWVTVAGLSGSVETLSIRTMRVRAGDGSLHVIPFSSVSTVTNVNRGKGNAAVKVVVSSREDTDRVGDVLKDIAARMRTEDAYKSLILDDFALWGVDDIDGATATIVGNIPCTDSGRWGVQREFNRRVKKRFEEEGIEIAVPTQAILLGRPHRDEPAPRKPGTPARTSEDANSGAIPESPPPTALGNGS